jgi:quaternary ammonium compound-resistance protein SugE
MAWLCLLVGGILECAWAIGLKYTEGFTRLWPSVFTIVAIIGSMWLLAIAARTLPIGTAYPVWVGIGAVGSVVLGALLFREPLDARRVAFLALIVIGIVGLRSSHAR